VIFVSRGVISGDHSQTQTPSPDYGVATVSRIDKITGLLYRI